MEDSDPRIVGHYDELANQWSQFVDSDARTKVLWSTLEPMLPDLTVRRVLDAGCGSGFYAAKLIDRGAEVIGVDISESMVAEARATVPDATFHTADLGESLEVIEDDHVDMVLCQHVFSHLPDLETPLTEFARVLSDGGVLVVSAHNPVFYYLVVRDGHYPTGEGETDLHPKVESGRRAPRYMETERFDITWNPGPTGNRATYYRRPVEGLVGPVLDAGFSLEEIVEPGADESSGDENTTVTQRPPDYPPESICLRATL